MHSQLTYTYIHAVCPISCITSLIINNHFKLKFSVLTAWHVSYRIILKSPNNIAYDACFGARAMLLLNKIRCFSYIILRIHLRWRYAKTMTLLTYHTYVYSITHPPYTLIV